MFMWPYSITVKTVDIISKLMSYVSSYIFIITLVLKTISILYTHYYTCIGFLYLVIAKVNQC